MTPKDHSKGKQHFAYAPMQDHSAHIADNVVVAGCPSCNLDVAKKIIEKQKKGSAPMQRVGFPSKIGCYCDEQPCKKDSDYNAGYLKCHDAFTAYHSSPEFREKMKELIDIGIKGFAAGGMLKEAPEGIAEAIQELIKGEG